MSVIYLVSFEIDWANQPRSRFEIDLEKHVNAIVPNSHIIPNYISF